MAHSSIPTGPAALRILNLPAQNPQTLQALRPIAGGAAVTLLAIAGLHAAWAAGRTWPYADGATLSRHVLGIPESPGIPSAAATVAVTAALALTGAAAVARTSNGPRLRGAARLITMPAAAVLAIRGLGGFAQSLLAPGAATAEFTRNDLRIYSPLCLALAAGLAVLEKSTKQENR